MNVSFNSYRISPVRRTQPQRHPEERRTVTSKEAATAIKSLRAQCHFGHPKITQKTKRRRIKSNVGPIKRNAQTRMVKANRTRQAQGKTSGLKTKRRTQDHPRRKRKD